MYSKSVLFYIAISVMFFGICGVFILLITNPQYFLGLSLFLITLIAIELSVFYKKRWNAMKKESQAFKQKFSSMSNNFDLEKFDVYLTAFNDELGIGQVVSEFKNHNKVSRVFVVDNKSIDKTAEEARRNGAFVLTEERQGYGRAVYRCLSHACECSTPWFIVCEGDGTFKAADIDKFIPYLNNAVVVNGTRIVEQLREPDTQLTNFIYFGNFFAAKLLEFRRMGKGTITDLGTTYKVIHRDSISQLLENLNPNVNFEFNAHFIDKCLQNDIPFLEVPIEFKRRIGASKGGNKSNLAALMTGLRMIVGIATNWRLYRIDK